MHGAFRAETHLPVPLGALLLKCERAATNALYSSFAENNSKAASSKTPSLEIFQSYLDAVLGNKL